VLDKDQHKIPYLCFQITLVVHVLCFLVDYQSKIGINFRPKKLRQGRQVVVSDKTLKTCLTISLLSGTNRDLLKGIRNAKWIIVPPAL